MILLFHLLSTLLMKWKENRKWSSFSMPIFNLDSHPLAERDSNNDIKFDPPMYKQRYERALLILQYDKWSGKINKIVDFGCAEFGLFVFIKNQTKATELLFVDTDELLLRDYLFRIQPLNADYLLPSKRAVNVKAFCGSISSPDPCLRNTDAVIAIEIIEHLYPDVLEGLPYNIFSFIHPKIVVVTTPNVEFNILFKNPKKCRHHDHKFEWTREQFESWALNITTRFPHYIVRFESIGFGPLGTENLNIGCCSQLALFIRKDLICDTYTFDEDCTCCSNIEEHSCLCSCLNCAPHHSFGICTNNNVPLSYSLLANINFPQFIETRSEETILLDELTYRINLFKNVEYYNIDQNHYEIPLKRLLYKSSTPLPDENEIRAFLTKFNYKIQECCIDESKETCIIYESDMDPGASGSDSEASGYESDKCELNEAPETDWRQTDEFIWNHTEDKEASNPTEDIKTKLHLEVNCTKAPEEALTDSGYQKSPNDASPPKPNEAIALDFKPLNEKPKQLSNILSVFDNFDKINELDTVRKDKKHFNFQSSNLSHREVMRKICQEIAKHPVAGPSRDSRRPKQKTPTSDSDESAEDVKSITTCILENSLNKIECQREPLRGHLIQEMIAEEENEAPEAIVVENGDLANNNRDLEGNNYEAEENEAVVDNLDPNNVNIDNNNEIIDDVVFVEPVIEEEDQMDLEPAVEVAWSSREALFDVNSQVDLLEDFEMDIGAIPNENIVIDPENDGDVAVLPDDNSFPNWLLQIFEEGEGGEDDEDDDAHFYCQGDGIGVHPSTVAVNEDADDEGNDSESDSSSSSSSNGSVNYASAENHSIQDLFVNNEMRNENLVVVGQQLAENPSSSIGTEEAFENAEGSASDLVTNSCPE